jgi:peptidoglycan hydrolase-like protein with peptidoglycan-binding domain
LFCFGIAKDIKALSGNITQINFTSLPQTIMADTASEVFTTQTQNISSVEEQVSETGTVLEYSSSSSTGQFSTANATACTGTFSGSPFTLSMSSGTANKRFCYKDGTAGTYTLTITAQGKSWTPATQIITINALVVSDITPPVITLLGSDPVNIQVGDIYTDAGATALDNIDGDITSKIVVTNLVDTSVAGTYTVKYNVSDLAGNNAVEMTRTVYVNAIIVTPPDVTPSIVHKSSGSFIRPQNNIITQNNNSSPNILPIGEVLGAEKFNFNNDLYFGTRSNDVKEFQKFLISKDLLKEGTLGGYFGIRTKNALMAYQKANALWVDGIVGPQTRGMLNK